MCSKQTCDIHVHITHHMQYMYINVKRSVYVLGLQYTHLTRQSALSLSESRVFGGVRVERGGVAVGVGVGEVVREGVGVGVGVGTRPPWRGGGSAISCSTRPIPATRGHPKQACRSYFCVQYYLHTLLN